MMSNHTKIPEYWQESCDYLTQADPVMGGIIGSYQGETLQGRGDAFFTLARSIVGQQISVKAADAVWNRLVDAHAIAPKDLLAAEEEALRACGLSRQKVLYLKSLSEFFLEYKIKPGYWNDWEDDAIIRHVTQIKGIGVWTAEMFLIFHLLRPNVFPVDDLGVLNAIRRHYPRKRFNKKQDYQRLAKKWAPYRTVATWYLWRSLDPLPVSY